MGVGEQAVVNQLSCVASGGKTGWGGGNDGGDGNLGPCEASSGSLGTKPVYIAAARLAGQHQISVEIITNTVKVVIMVVIMEIILEIHMVISKDSLSDQQGDRHDGSGAILAATSESDSAKVHLCDLISCDILPALTAELMSQ